MCVCVSRAPDSAHRRPRSAGCAGLEQHPTLWNFRPLLAADACQQLYPELAAQVMVGGVFLNEVVAQLERRAPVDPSVNLPALATVTRPPSCCRADSAFAHDRTSVSVCVCVRLCGGVCACVCA